MLSGTLHNYYNKLNISSPKLTHVDKRLCILLILRPGQLLNLMMPVDK